MHRQGYSYADILARVVYVIKTHETKMADKYDYVAQRVDDTRKNTCFGARLSCVDFPTPLKGCTTTCVRSTTEGAALR